MTILTLRDRLISDGIAEVKQVYPPDSYKQRGALAGFELCRRLETKEEFEQTLADRAKYERDWVCRYHSGTAEPDSGTMAEHVREPIDEYREHRWATLQVEHIYKRLMILWGAPTVSARAVIQVAEILKESAGKN